MNEILDKLKLYNFEKQLKKLEKKYQNKKIILYGIGKYFDAIIENYNFSKLNIIAISDIEYEKLKKSNNKNLKNYNIVAPAKIHLLNPDIVLLTTENDYFIEKYFRETLFKETRKKFKYKPILTLPLYAKIQRDWEIL